MLGRAERTEEVTKSVASFFVCLGGDDMVKINGEKMEVAGMTLTQYLATTKFDPQRIAIERNGDIVPKAQYSHTVLEDGDSVEIVSFVGGG